MYRLLAVILCTVLMTFALVQCAEESSESDSVCSSFHETWVPVDVKSFAPGSEHKITYYLEADPDDARAIYCSGYYSQDCGATWTSLLDPNLAWFGEDEWYVEPGNTAVLWYAGEIPYVRRSPDRGKTWVTIANPGSPGAFNFCAVNTMVRSQSGERLYVINDGYGLFRGVRQTAGYEWTHLDQAHAEYSSALAVDPRDETRLFVGTIGKSGAGDAAVRRSLDGGDSWHTVLENTGYDSISDVAVDPLNPSIVYCSAVGEGGVALIKSDDGGTTWYEPADNFNGVTIHGFAVSSGQDSTAYADVWGGGLFRTEDGGGSWQRIDAREQFSTAAMAVDPRYPDVIYVADRTCAAIYRSMDGGKHWHEFFRAGPEYRRFMALVIDPHDSDRLYASAMASSGMGRSGSLLRLDATGSTDITGTLPKVVLDITIDPQDPTVLYVVLHESGVYKSTDFGHSWTCLSGETSGLPPSGFFSLTVDPNNNNRLYLAGGCDVLFSSFDSAGLDPDLVNGVYKSDDGGQSWQSMNNSVLGRGSGAVKNLAFLENNSAWLYVATDSGVYYSRDGGLHWIHSAGLPFENLSGIALQKRTVYAFTRGGGVFIGTIQPDFSIAWNPGQNLAVESFSVKLTIDPETPSALYATAFPGGVFKSLDGGTTWHEANFGLPVFSVKDPLRQGYYTLAISPSEPDVLYLGLYRNGIFKSTNRGFTWRPIHGTNGKMAKKMITDIVVDHQNSSLIYVSTVDRQYKATRGNLLCENGVYCSVNGGLTWMPLNHGLATDVRTLVQTPLGTILAGTRGYGLFELQNNAWKALQPCSILQASVIPQFTSIVVHSEDHDRILIGTSPQGFYRSENGGQTWRESNLGLPFEGVVTLCSHPTEADIVFAGTTGGLVKTSTFGKSWEEVSHEFPEQRIVIDIDIDPHNPAIVYACTHEKIGGSSPSFLVKSFDGGRTWIELPGVKNNSWEIISLVIDPTDSEKLYLATANQGPYVSHNGGVTWARWNEGLPEIDVDVNYVERLEPLAVSTDGAYLFWSSPDQGLYKRSL